MTSDHRWYHVRGAAVRDHQVDVPLNWSDPSGETITVFAREVVAPDRVDAELPWLLFLQGGPGHASPRVTSAERWLEPALREFRVLLLDQRGTGRSTPLHAQSIQRHGSARAAAEYLTHFRADSIVADAEHLRQTLAGGQPWSILGQSYGGFLATTYLSFAPEGLRSCMIAAGVPPLLPRLVATDVYQRTYELAANRSLQLYARFPWIGEHIAEIADRLAADGPASLPSVRRLQTAGFELGYTDGAERMLWLVESALDAHTTSGLSAGFLERLTSSTSLVARPLWAVLHDSIYASATSGPTMWAADRAAPAEFDPARRPLLFSTEHMRSWMFEEFEELRPFRAVAEELAGFDGWTDLYDLERLRSNTVPVSVALFLDDAFVPFDLAIRSVEAIAGAEVWVTSEFQHDGLRHDDTVYRRLRGLLDEPSMRDRALTTHELQEAI